MGFVSRLFTKKTSSSESLRQRQPAEKGRWCQLFQLLALSSVPIVVLLIYSVRDFTTYYSLRLLLSRQIGDYEAGKVFHDILLAVTAERDMASLYVISGYDPLVFKEVKRLFNKTDEIILSIVKMDHYESLREEIEHQHTEHNEDSGICSHDVDIETCIGSDLRSLHLTLLKQRKHHFLNLTHQNEHKINPTNFSEEHSFEKLQFYSSIITFIKLALQDHLRPSEKYFKDEINVLQLKFKLLHFLAEERHIGSLYFAFGSLPEKEWLKYANVCKLVQEYSAMMFMQYEVAKKRNPELFKMSTNVINSTQEDSLYNFKDETSCHDQQYHIPSFTANDVIKSHASKDLIEQRVKVISNIIQNASIEQALSFFHHVSKSIDKFGTEFEYNYKSVIPWLKNQLQYLVNWSNIMSAVICATLGFGTLTFYFITKLTSSMHVVHEASIKAKDKLLLENRRTNFLLYQMLPIGYSSRLRHQNAVPPEYYAEITILMSDIVGFAAIVEVSSAFETVNMLNFLYMNVDARLELHDVYKVYCYADAFTIISGLPKRNHFHDIEICALALDLMATFEPLKIPHIPEQSYQFRIGIDTGSCVAGVAGSKMPRFCCYGEAIATACRMLESCYPQRIQISSRTAQKLKDTGFDIELRDSIYKGDALMGSYWLTGPKPTENSEISEQQYQKKRNRRMTFQTIFQDRFF